MELNSRRKEEAIQFDLWSIMMSEMAKDKEGAPKPLPPLKRSVISMNHNSLRLCTETLGSESDPLPEEDLWSIMMSERAKDKEGAPKSLPPLKRSVISMNHKSLQLCTETLGSESDPLPGTETLGSESDPLPDISPPTYNINNKMRRCFSSYPPTETVKQQQGQPQKQDEKVCGAFENKEESRDCIVMGKQSHNACSSKKLSKPRSRSFPPPLTSLSSMELEPRRDNGRLVLQAVSLFPSRNQFQASRSGATR